MPTLHGIVTGDWHLDALKSHFPSDHIDKQLAECEKIYIHAVKHGIPHVFIAGDLFDSSASPLSTCIKLLKLLCKYSKHTDTHILAGNHDWSDVNRTALDFLEELINMEMLKNVYVYKDLQKVNIDGINVNFIPHGSEPNPKSKEPSINFVHRVVQGLVGDNGKLLKKYDDYVCSKHDFTFGGHVHKYQYLEDKDYVNVGSPYQKTFGEGFPKGFVEFTAKTSKKNKKLLKVKHRHVAIKPEFRLETKIIKTQEDLGKLSNSYNVRLRLIVDGDVDIPSDLTRVYPNIAHILDSKGKKVSETDSSVKISKESFDLPEINPTLGLSKHLKLLGFSKKQRNQAKSIVSEALAVSKSK